MFKNVMAALDVSKLASTRYIPVSALKNCDPECFYILADLLNVYFRNAIFQIFVKPCQWCL